MIRFIKYTLIASLAFIFAGAEGQTSQVLYYMNLPQNHLMNPAMHPTNSVSVELPLISGLYVGLNNNFINYSDIFRKSNTSDSVYSFLSSESNVDDFLARVNKKNSLSPQITIPILGVGFKGNNGFYFFIDINERLEANAVLPGDLIKLVLKGNGAFVGDKIDFSSLRMDMRYYREFGFTISKDITKDLRVGIRPKLLTGIMSTKFANESLGIKVNQDYSHTLDANFTANFSGPFSVMVDSANNLESIKFDDQYFNNFNAFASIENRGLGLDLGATYNLLNNKVIVSAALTDLGYVKWNRDVTNITVKGNYTFDGLDMTDVVNGDKDIKDVVDEIVDTLKQRFDLKQTFDPYTTWLAPGLTLAGSYNLNKSISFGVLSYSRFIGKQVRESLTLSANLNVSNAFSFSWGYTLQNHRADNFGAGLAFRAGFFQFYLISDRIPVNWSKLKLNESSNIVVPENWNTVNLRLGLNLTFGNKVRKKDDKPMIENEQTF